MRLSQHKSVKPRIGDTIKRLTSQEIDKISVQDWHDNGRPCMWVLSDSVEIDGIRYDLFEDAGFGMICITIDDEIIAIGSGSYALIYFNQNGNGVEVVALPCSITGECAKLYHR